MQVLPGLLESLFRPPMSGPGLQLYINAYNSVWVFVFVCVAYAVVRCPGYPRQSHTAILVTLFLAASVVCMHCSPAEVSACLLACF